MADSSTQTLGLKVNEHKRSFGFAFNDSDFSDRVLRLEILPLDSNRDTSCSKVVTLHICSAILAERSPFFFKLFKNGMKETQERSFVTLKIDASEEAPFMDLMKFIYDNTLNATSAPELLDVLMVANKYEVTSCMEYCIELLLKLPMSTDRARFYLELPSIVFVGEAIQPLIDAAKRCMAARFGNFTKSIQAEAMTLPLRSLKVVLGIDGLQVDSEDFMLDFILEWARRHYPNIEVRKEILTMHLTRFIYFPYLRIVRLKKLRSCVDFDRGKITDLVCEALYEKAEAPYGQHLRASKTTPGLPRRVYNFRLVKVVEFDFTQPQTVVYFSLKKEECANLFPSKSLISEAFFVGSRNHMILEACCTEEQNSSTHHFSIWLHTLIGACTLYDLEIAVLKKRFKEFQSIVSGKDVTLRSKSTWGRCNVFGISWDEFMKDSSVYFVDGILHFRFTLTFKNSQA